MSKEDTKIVEAPKKSRKWLIAVAVVLGLIFISSLGGDGVKDATDSANKAADKLQEKVEENTKKTKTVEEWQKVTTLSGSADKNGSPFKISDKAKRWKATYTISNPSQYSLLNVYAKKPGADFGDTVVTFAKKSGETVMYTTGEYYLEVSSANANWKIQVEQLVDVEKPI